jgi:hypothetical protein
MLGSAFAKAWGYVERFGEVAALHPLLCTVLALCVLPFAAAGVAAIVRRQGPQALWSTVGVLVVLLVFSWGDDTYTHVYRVVAMADQIRAGELSLLLTNSATGVVLPTFVYYSALPYVLPVALNLIGLPALVAFKLALVVQLVVMALGVQRIVEKTSAGFAGFLAAVLYMSANYSYEIWLSRAAFAELWVYSLIPWVVSYTIFAPSTSGRPTRATTAALTLVFFLQAVAHPIVLAHSLLCEVPVAMVLARVGPFGLARRWIVPFTLALVLAVPFWLPQALWQNLILGPAALPVDFRNSVLSLAELLDPKNNRNMGPWLPAAVVAMVAAARLRLAPRTWFLVATWAVLIGLQTVYLRAITLHIPTLELSLFVWRLMLPTAFVAFAALVSRWQAVPPVYPRALGVLAAVSVVFLGGFTVLEAPDYLPHLLAAKNDRDALIAYDVDKDAAIWGIREYIPDYRTLPQVCAAVPAGDIRPTRFAALDRPTGVAADKPYLSIVRAPIGMVDYRVDGHSTAPSACGEDLVFGPLAPGAKLTVTHRALDLLLLVRGVMLAALAFLMGYALYRMRRPSRS